MNERQYRITRTEAERFEQALAGVDDHTRHLSPKLRQAMREGLESQLEELREQLAEYDILRASPASTLEFRSLDELPETLIRARIVAGLTQQALAERLGLKAQQVQRYEATRYAGISLRRLRDVAAALGLSVQGTGTVVQTRAEEADDAR
jgi:ribosome-binding protein aMBF1 (putative translation factor)